MKGILVRIPLLGPTKYWLNIASLAVLAAVSTYMAIATAILVYVTVAHVGTQPSLAMLAFYAFFTITSIVDTVWTFRKALRPAAQEDVVRLGTELLDAREDVVNVITAGRMRVKLFGPQTLPEFDRAAARLSRNMERGVSQFLATRRMTVLRLAKLLGYPSVRLYEKVSLLAIAAPMKAKLADRNPDRTDRITTFWIVLVSAAAVPDPDLVAELKDKLGEYLKNLKKDYPDLAVTQAEVDDFIKRFAPTAKP